MCSNCSGDYEDPEMTAEEDEPLEGQELLRELFQRILAYSYSTARARNLAAYLQNSSPLVGKHKLDVSWSDL